VADVEERVGVKDADKEQDGIMPVKHIYSCIARVSTL
jgi:hypothetical protein